MNTAKVVVVTIANTVRPGLCNLIRSARIHDFALYILGADLPNEDLYTFLEKKPKIFLDFLKSSSIQDSDTIVFVDGYDVLIQGPSREMDPQITDNNPLLLFSGESWCWPWNLGNKHVSSYCKKAMNLVDQSEKIACSPKMLKWEWVDKERCDPLKGHSAIVFPFLNSGMYLGSKRNIMNFLNEYLTYNENPKALHGFTDQGSIQDMIYLQKNDTFFHHHVDRYAKIFLNVCCPQGALSEHRVTWDEKTSRWKLAAHETRGETTPTFIHWNAGLIGKADFMHKKLLDAQSAFHGIYRGSIHIHPYNVNETTFLRGCGEAI